VELWFDGVWDKDSPTKSWDHTPEPPNAPLNPSPWRWAELDSHIQSLQPACLVINNTGSHQPGRIRYEPTDIRTVEHFEFVRNGTLRPPPNPDPDTRTIEFSMSLNPDWFHTGMPC